jgi:hypothetical protein
MALQKKAAIIRRYLAMLTRAHLAWTARRPVLSKFGFLDAPVLAVSVNGRSFGHQTRESLASGLAIDI